MNFCLATICLLLCFINMLAAREGSKIPSTTRNPAAVAKLANFKETEKVSYPKKVNSLKKTQTKANRKKVAADITDKFKDLPDDDLAFIKELDKQFKLHGGKIKIKVENKNVSETKNSKRTIDGELGYGYAHNGYHYDPPKFMFYPYSQQNIDSNAPGYFLNGDEKTQVSIEPSYSYELKSQTYVTHNEPQIDVPKEPQQSHAPAAEIQQQHYEEPVIVLRIPGPAKYATHLQMLLQKYLEIRAAQYLRILEEAEQQQQQQHHQPQHNLQQLDYGHEHDHEHSGQIEEQQQQQHYQQQQHHHYDAQQVDYHQQQAGIPQAEQQYPDIDHVYHSYKYRHSGQHVQHSQVAEPEPESYDTSQPNAEESPQYNAPEHFHYQQQPIQQQQHPQFYYSHQQEYAQPEGPPANSYHQVLLLAMTHPQQVHQASELEQTEERPQQAIYVQEQKESSLSVPIAENNPRPSHTKVIFTNKHAQATNDYQMYQLPSIKPNERHAPTSTPDFHQDFHHQPEKLNNYQQPQQHTAAVETSDSAAQAPQVVAITQRPYNYHAHNVKARARGRTGHTRRAVSAKEADQGLEKIREYVRDKLGAETGSAVEFKTTQIIAG